MRFMLSIVIIWPCPWRYSFQPQHFSRSFLISTRLDLLFCSIAFPFTFLYFIISKKPCLRFPNYFHDSFCIALRETNQANFGYHLKLIQKNRQAKIILYQAFSSTFCTLILYSNAIVSLLFHILLCSCIQMLFHRNVFQNDQESLRWNRNTNISYIQGFMQILYNVLYFLRFFVKNIFLIQIDPTVRP